MDRYTPQTPPSGQDLAIAKSRLRVAAIQASPAEIVRHHPWASVIGTFSSSMALAALIGGKRSAKSSANKKPAQSGGMQFPRGLVPWAINLGVQLVQAHMTRQAVEKSARNVPPEEPNAVG